MVHCFPNNIKDKLKELFSLQYRQLLRGKENCLFMFVMWWPCTILIYINYNPWGWLRQKNEAGEGKGRKKIHLPNLIVYLQTM